jgi:FtsH-binding integral membrane protein
MGLGLGISALVAYIISLNGSLFLAMFSSRVTSLTLFSLPFFLVVALQASIHRISKTAVATMFIVYAAMMGASLSYIFLIFSPGSLASVFGVSAALFTGMGVYGAYSKRDLASFGSFLMMGVLGLVIAMIVNIFMKNSALEMLLSALAVLLFTGLTAYDTQRIRRSYDSELGDSILAKGAIIGALYLYLDFVNIFLALLRFNRGK